MLSRLSTRSSLTLALATSTTLRLSTLPRAQAALDFRAPYQFAASYFNPSIEYVRSYSMGSNASTAANFPKGKTEDAWRAQLSPEQFRVLRKAGTEAAGTGKYDKHYPTVGTYNCAGCDTPLYKADTKFKSGCGWPAFFDSIPGAITRKEDRMFGMTRIEILCAACGAHQGHVFKGEGFDTPTDERHCVNSVSLRFSEDDK